MNYLLLISALTLSAIAAFYAISGLVAIFAAAVIPIIIMGSSLEASKLVLASWMYRNWGKCPVLMKTYFTFALVVLMMLTSMGIFGFLSKAHLDQAKDTGGNSLQIQLIDNKIERQQQRINDSNIVIGQLDKAVQVLIDNDRIRGKNGSIAVRESQKEERAQLNSVIDDASETISKLRQEKLTLDKERIEIEAEVGPIKYIAALIYGDENVNNTILEKSVRIVIIMIVVVFDPLAVLMVVAANWSLYRREEPVIKLEEEPKEVSPTPKKFSNPSQHLKNQNQ